MLTMRDGVCEQARLTIVGMGEGPFRVRAVEQMLDGADLERQGIAARRSRRLLRRLPPRSIRPTMSTHRRPTGGIWRASWWHRHWQWRWRERESNPLAREQHIRVTVNGRAYEKTVPVRLSLADFLRDHLHLTGTHLGCEHGVCGACTITMNGRSARSCLTLAVQADGAEIVTIEGLRAEDGTRHPMQQVFLENFALQCGYCTPGMLITAIELLRDNPNPDRARSARSYFRQPLPLQRLPGHRRRRSGRAPARSRRDVGHPLRQSRGWSGRRCIPDEAIPLVEGDGRFLNDIKLPGMYHVAFLRSQHAHARLNSVDASEARKLPGVIKVLTGKELLGKVDPFRSMPNRFSGGESVQHWLAVDKVRFCGEAICAVVAEDRATAEDAVRTHQGRLRAVAGGDGPATRRAGRLAACA